MSERFELNAAVSVHQHTCGEDGIFVNAYLVESPHGVVAIDATLSLSTARAFRRRFEKLGKPLLAVLVTHPHPDHVAGLAVLVDDDATPIVATRPVLDLMRRLEAPKRAQWTPVYGDEWVQRWRYPNRIVEDAASLSFDGVTYTVHDLGGGGDSDANTIWLAKAPQPVAFVSDLVFNRVHAYLADGGVLAWLANLERVAELCRDCGVMFPGHGAAGSPAELIAAQRRYLLAYIGHLIGIGGTRSALTDADKAELTKRMEAVLPDAGLTFLIGMSADSVWRELRN